MHRARVVGVPWSRCRNPNRLLYCCHVDSSAAPPAVQRVSSLGAIENYVLYVPITPRPDTDYCNNCKRYDQVKPCVVAQARTMHCIICWPSRHVLLLLLLLPAVPACFTVTQAGSPPPVGPHDHDHDPPRSGRGAGAAPLCPCAL